MFVNKSLYNGQNILIYISLQESALNKHNKLKKTAELHVLVFRP